MGQPHELIFEGWANRPRSIHVATYRQTHAVNKAGIENSTARSNERRGKAIEQDDFHHCGTSQRHCFSRLCMPGSWTLSELFILQGDIAGGVPGILIGAAVSMALVGGAHGGAPLGMLLLIATPINFLLYVGLGVAARKLVKVFIKRNEKPT